MAENGSNQKPLNVIVQIVIGMKTQKPQLKNQLVTHLQIFLNNTFQPKNEQLYLILSNFIF